MTRLARPSGVLPLLVALTACGEEGSVTMEPPPSGPPTLSADVQPIFDNSCAFNGCHGGTITEPPEKPMSLAAGQSRLNTVGVESVQVAGMARITAGDPEASYLVHKIQGTQGQVGGSGERMPLNLPALSPVAIEVIREWITDGARDN